MSLSVKKALGLVLSALVLAGLAWGYDATPTATLEFPVTPAPPTATLPIEATYDALVSASATALVVTPPILLMAVLAGQFAMAGMVPVPALKWFMPISIAWLITPLQVHCSKPAMVAFIRITVRLHLPGPI